MFLIAKFYNSLRIKLFSNLFPNNCLEKVQRSFQQCSEFINQISHHFFQTNIEFIYAMCLVFVISFFPPFTTTKVLKFIYTILPLFPKNISLSSSEYFSLWIYAQFYLKAKNFHLSKLQFKFKFYPIWLKRVNCFNVTLK